MSEAIPFVIKVLAKSMDTSLATDKVELATITGGADGAEVSAGMRGAGVGGGRRAFPGEGRGGGGAQRSQR